MLCSLLSVQPGARLELVPAKPLMYVGCGAEASMPTVLLCKPIPIGPCCFADVQTACVCMSKRF